MNICFWGEKKYKILKNPKTLKKKKQDPFLPSSTSSLALTLTSPALLLAMHL